MSPHQVNFADEYRLPGVSPSRLCATTFSAQRYDPRPPRPPPTVRVDDSLVGPTRRAASEPLQIKTLQVLPDLHAFPQASAKLLGFTRGVQGGDNAHQILWAQNMPTITVLSLPHHPKRGCRKIIGLMKRRIVDSLTTMWAGVCSGIGYLQNSVSRVTGLINKGA